MATTAATSATPRKPAKPAATCSVPDGEPVPVMKGSHVYLIDGSGWIFRAFHALPPLTRPSDRLPVGAIHGFCGMLWKLMQDSRKSAGPTHIAVVFDYSEKTFRNEIYKDYKAHRPPMPEELIPQFRVIRDAVKAFNIACIEQEGYEADDLIATYARQALAAAGDVTIVSSDKDLMQMVGPGVTMLDTMKTPPRSIGPDEVRERFGVPPDKVVDVQALAGDSTDNVPGVPGIGVKTAAELISEYGDLDTLLERAGEIKQPKRRERLTEFALQARLSRELVRLKQDVPMTVPLERLGLHEPDADALLGFMREMEFTTLTKRIAEGLGKEVPPPVERASVAVPRASPGPGRRPLLPRRMPSRPTLVSRNAAGRRDRRRRRSEGRQDRSLAIRDGHGLAAPGSLDRGSLRRWPPRLRYRDDQPRSHAGRVRRPLHGRGTGPGLLRAARPSARERRLRLRWRGR